MTTLISDIMIEDLLGLLKTKKVPAQDLKRGDILCDEFLGTATHVDKVTIHEDGSSTVTDPLNNSGSAHKEHLYTIIDEICLKDNKSKESK